MTFGEKLRQLRTEKGYTQEKLADILSVSRQTIQKWESDINYPEINKLKQISALFDVSIDYLLDEKTDQINEQESKSKEDANNKNPQENVKTANNTYDNHQYNNSYDNTYKTTATIMFVAFYGITLILNIFLNGGNLGYALGTTIGGSIISIIFIILVNKKTVGPRGAFIFYIIAFIGIFANYETQLNNAYGFGLASLFAFLFSSITLLYFYGLVFLCKYHYGNLSIKELWMINKKEEKKADIIKEENTNISKRVVEPEIVALTEEMIKYQDAVKLFNDKEYKKALPIFESIQGFKDSDDLAERCKSFIEKEKEATYLYAINLSKAYKYHEAINSLSKIIDYKDSKELLGRYKKESVKEDKYEEAIDLTGILASISDYEKAIRILSTIIDYRDSKNLIDEYNTEIERKKENRIKFKQISIISLITIVILTTIILLTIYLFIPLGKYNKAQRLINEGNYYEAQEVLLSLPRSFSDSNNQIVIAQAYSSIERGNYEEAIDKIYDLGGTVVIEYDTDGGNEIENDILKKLNHVTKTPTKNGYTFDCWTVKNYDIKNKKNDYSLNLVLIANYKPNVYSISYNYGCSNYSIEQNHITKYTVGNETIINSPTRKGYTFTGWTGNGIIVPTKEMKISSNTYGNINLTANWLANEYTINLNVNGGICDTNNVITSYDEKFNLPTPTRIGYEFAGWYYENKSINGTINNYNENITVTAHWNAITYSISYLNTFNDNLENIQYYNIETSYTLENPSRDGYTFIGWSENGSEQLVLNKSINKGTIGELSFKAYWAPNNYTISLNLNGGACEVNSVTTTYDDSFSLPTPTRTGYEFAGWYYNLNEFTNGVWNKTTDISITANWNPINVDYVVNYYRENIEDNNYTLFSSLVEQGLSDSSISPEPVEYYGFETPSVQNKTISPDGSLVIDYYYQRIEYTLSFITNGGSNVSNFTKKYGTIVDKNDVLTSRNDSSFDDWFTEVDIINKFQYVLDKDYVLYAHFEGESVPSNFEYEIKNDECKVVKYLGEEANIKIPKYINNKIVSSIESNAFKDNTDVKNIVIPESIISIGEYAFSDCTSLSSVNIPSGIKIINSGVFNNCSSLLEITIPKSVETIVGGSFNGCSSLKTLSVPFIGEKRYSNDSINKYNLGFIFGSTEYDDSYSIKPVYYANNEYLEAKYYIPDSLKKIIITDCDYIQYGALSLNSSVNEIIILSNVLYIGPSAFEGTSIVSFDIPENITTLSGNIFHGCTNLKTINNINNISSIGTGAFFGCSSLETIVLPNGISSIPEYSFYNCSSLSSIHIPCSITSIANNAFIGCKSSLDNYIEINSFNDWIYCQYKENFCGSIHFMESSSNEEITEVVVQDGVYSINMNMFKNCRSITSITIPNSVISIDAGAFSGCSSLEHLSLPFVGNVRPSDNEEYPLGFIFGTDNFYGSYSIIQKYQYHGSKETTYYVPLTLKSITITDCEYLQYGSFYNCSSIETINISSNISSVDVNSFYGCNIKNATGPYIAISKIPKDSLESIVITSCSSINHFEFANCSLLKNVSILDNITSIGSHAFENCISLVDINLPDTVLTIGECAFKGCSSIYSFDISSNITSIEPCTFEGCSSLKRVNSTIDGFFNIPQNITTIENNAFSGCSSLINISIPNEIEFVGGSIFSDCDNIIFNVFDNASYVGNNENPYLILVKANNINIASCNIHNGCNFLMDNSFKDCVNLSSIVIPEHIKSVGIYTFRSCESLSSVLVQNGVNVIMYGAFYDCSSLTSIAIPNSVTKIGEKTFYGCSNLENLSLPFVGDKRHLSTDQYIYPLGYIFGTTEFNNSYAAEQYYIENNSLPQKTYYIPNSLKVVKITDNSFIPTGVFSYCSSIENVVLPENITYIPAYGFLNCVSLKSIIIPNGVTRIGYWSFYNCYNLKSVIIPKTLNTIDQSAFKNVSLNYVYFSGTASDWNISIDNTAEGNNCIVNGNKYYYSETEPVEPGNYWYYGNDKKPVIWS